MAAGRLVVMLRNNAGTAVKVVLLVAAAVVDPSGAAVSAIRAAIDAISKTKSTKASLTVPDNYSTTSAAGAYEDDQDKAALLFIDAAGKYHNFKVPAPKAAIFQADGESVDLSNAAVITFAGHVTGNFIAPTGAALVSLVSGRRIRMNAGRSN